MDQFGFDFETKKQDKRGLNDVTILGIIVEYFETLVVLNNRNNKIGDLLEFDGPYEGIAIFSNVPLDDAGVKK